MKLCWITLSVKDMEESLHFYHGLLGLEIQERFPAGDVEIAMLGPTDKPKIELVCNSQNPISAKASGLSAGFEVDSLDAALEYVKAKGIAVKKGPFSPAPNVRFFYIEDPNGIEIQIVEHK